MVSKFVGRDYSTLRSEIIEFLRVRLPNDWDYNNLADPVVIFAESLARVGDQLHYTIDELRRECDVATAKRSSSIYSYAMREGYKMMLPRAAFGTLSINTIPEQDGLLHLALRKFDAIKVKPAGETLYVVNENDSRTGYAINADLHAPVDKAYAATLADYYDNDGVLNKEKRGVYQAYVDDVYNKTQHVNVVLGTKRTFSFTYNDINKDSTVELPTPMIDRTLVRLTYKSSSGSGELTYVDDVISSGFDYETFTLTPKFIGGAITLCIEFPTNYKDIFKRDLTTKFSFEYIEIKNSKVEPLDEYSTKAEAVDFGDAISVVSGHENDATISDSGLQYRVDFGNGIKGYTEYESANITRENYKKFVQNYSALLTKDDYQSYIKATSSSHCKVFDHGDCYKSPAVLPEGTDLLPRVIYAITDSPYNDRENLWYDLKERSSRSDCIVLIPFGKDPYTIVIKADCYLVGTSVATIASQIEKELLSYYADAVGEKIPKISMINYLVHKASDKVIRMESCIVRDTTYSKSDTTFNNVNQLDNDQIDELYSAFESGNVNYQSPIADDSQDDGTGEDYNYIFKGYRYVDANGVYYTQEERDQKESELTSEDFSALNIVQFFYNKYPRVTYLQYSTDSGSAVSTVEKEYRDFPESFPKIYYVNNKKLPIVSTYEDLITHQVTYGEIDDKDWDIPDDKIFEPSLKESWYKFTAPQITSIDTKLQFQILYVRAKDTEVKHLETGTWYGGDKPVLAGDYVQPKESAKLYQSPSTYSDTYSNTLDKTGLKYPKLTLLDNSEATMNISNEYKLHHYMVPVLNRVIVLIKAVNTKA